MIAVHLVDWRLVAKGRGHGYNDGVCTARGRWKRGEVEEDTREARWAFSIFQRRGNEI